MITKLFILATAIFLSSCSNKFAPTPSALAKPDLESRFNECSQTPQGKKYIVATSQEFLRAARLGTCILPGDPIHQPAVIYFGVDSVGAVNEVVVNPNSLLAVCIKEHVAGFKASPPPGNECVVRILLTFEGEENEEAS